MENIIVSNQQAESFLKSIWLDMLAYIEGHQEEYQKFLESESDGADTDS